MKFDSLFGLNLHFIRVQEYYESSSLKVRHKKFTFDLLMEEYADEHGNFTYFEDWHGFNTPGSVAKKFWEVFEGELWFREKQLKEELYRFVPDFDTEQCYIIATLKDDEETFDHELCHALWCLHKDYRRGMRLLMRAVPKRSISKFHGHLAKCGYGPNVLEDETQAYLATSRSCYLRSKVFHSYKGKLPDMRPFRRMFREFKDTHT